MMLETVKGIVVVEECSVMKLVNGTRWEDILGCDMDGYSTTFGIDALNELEEEFEETNDPRLKDVKETFEFMEVIAKEQGIKSWQVNFLIKR